MFGFSVVLQQRQKMTSTAKLLWSRPNSCKSSRSSKIKGIDSSMDLWQNHLHCL